MKRDQAKWDRIAGMHLEFLTAERKRLWQEREDGKALEKITLYSAHRIEQHLKDLARACEGR